MSTRVMVDVPSVAFKGPHDTDAKFFRQVAERMEEPHRHVGELGGSNVRRAARDLLLATASALEAGPLAGAERSVCGECEEPIYRHQRGTWYHTVTGVQRCYRDPHIEIAYPDPDVAIDAPSAPWVVVLDHGAEAPLFYIVQCSVCPQRAALAARPDPSGWTCPRCAEVTGGFGDVDVAQAEPVAAGANWDGDEWWLKAVRG
ncbi:hypothetical protein H7H51_07695 [Mycolicibacterium farcinogenes]|nr:hypothetical protein [Mycolicibacterium farcinogenes]